MEKTEKANISDTHDKKIDVFATQSFHVLTLVFLLKNVLHWIT